MGEMKASPASPNVFFILINRLVLLRKILRLWMSPRLALKLWICFISAALMYVNTQLPVMPPAEHNKNTFKKSCLYTTSAAGTPTFPTKTVHVKNTLRAFSNSLHIVQGAIPLLDQR